MIYSGTRGYLDDIEVKDVRRFEAHLLDHAKVNGRDILDDIRTTGKPVDDDRMSRLITAAKASFQA